MPDKVGPNPFSWDDFRHKMPVTRKWAYFDHAAVAPLSGPARRALAAWAEEAAEEGDVHWPQWSSRVEKARELGARLIGAEPADMALVHNTTEGINLVAESFPWEPGDNVVTLADEFPSNLYPWMNLAGRGVETRRVPTDGRQVDLEMVDAACDSRTRIVSVSWVGYASGWRNDVDALAEIAHRHGAMLFLDAIQGLGVFPLDVGRTKVDFLAADGHKWLLGPEGAGLFYTRREHLALLRPFGVGWNSVIHAYDFSRIELELKDSAARYEGGSRNLAGYIALAASLELLAQFGTEAISRRVLEITDLARRELQRIGALVMVAPEPEHRSGIVTFELPGRDPHAVRQQCLDQGVVLSCRAGRLRISPHAYVDETDVRRLIDAIQQE
ncbi:MAG: aminotransferase class V-fold PLP-dependent enzyme [Pirellulales bacterium]